MNHGRNTRARLTGATWTTSTPARMNRPSARLSCTGAAVAALALCGSAFAQSSAPLLQKEDLLYQGAFRVPQGSSEADSYTWGGTAIAYNPTNNSLFLTGHDHHQKTAEISIPAPVNSTSIGDLERATLLQGFRDATEGKLGSINGPDPNSKKIGGHLVHDGTLYVTGFSYYDGTGTQNSSHFSRPLNLATTGQVKGPFRVGSDPHFVSGYMTLIPPEWQTAFGGPALTGNCCLSITSVQSNGPAASVFDPANLGKANPVPATPVVGYPYPNVLGPGETTTNRLFNLTTQITGIVFPHGTRSVLFFGRQGVGTYCYGEGSACGDPADSSKGTHAYPYVYQVWAYDANDLVAVKNGKKLRYELQPYATWEFDLPFAGSGGMHQLGGAAYDSKSNLIYVSQRCVESQCTPIIHAFKVEEGAAPKVPKAPESVSVQ